MNNFIVTETDYMKNFLPPSKLDEIKKKPLTTFMADVIDRRVKNVSGQNSI